MSESYTGIDSAKKKEQEVSAGFDNEGNLHITSEQFGPSDLCEVRLTDVGGRVCYRNSVPVEQNSLYCPSAGLSKGAYILSVTRGNPGNALLYSGVVIR